jgi:hypothetical protein
MRDRRFFALFVTVVALALLAASGLKASAQSNQIPLLSDPLAGLKYDNRYELYVGMGYARLIAGPTLIDGTSMGGLDIQGTRWMTRKWGLMANVRTYYGNGRIIPNPYNVNYPLEMQHLFLAGPEYLGPHNKHAALTLHAVAGAAYGIFDTTLGTHDPTTGTPITLSTGQVGLFNSGVNFGAEVGGTIDLNRSPNWVFRIAPDLQLTNYQPVGGSGIQKNFAISVGAMYRFKKKR